MNFLQVVILVNHELMLKQKCGDCLGIPEEVLPKSIAGRLCEGSPIQRQIEIVSVDQELQKGMRNWLTGDSQNGAGLRAEGAKEGMTKQVALVTRKEIILPATSIGILGSGPVMQTNKDILPSGGDIFSPMQLFGSLWLALTQGSLNSWDRGHPNAPTADTCCKQIWETYPCWDTL